MDRLGFGQAIASSAPRTNIDFIIERLPFASRFRCVLSAEEIEHGKPAPDIFIAAGDCLRLQPSQCVVLEDAPAGVAAGKAAGCRVIAIAAGFYADRLRDADLVVKSFMEVMWPHDRWAAFLSG
jgi:beta-phosphoglucomutase